MLCSLLRKLSKRRRKNGELSKWKISRHKLCSAWNATSVRPSACQLYWSRRVGPSAVCKQLYRSLDLYVATRRTTYMMTEDGWKWTKAERPLTAGDFSYWPPLALPRPSFGPSLFLFRGSKLFYLFTCHLPSLAIFSLESVLTMRNFRLVQYKPLVIWSSLAVGEHYHEPFDVGERSEDFPLK